jgi:hypothetical protein
MAMDGCGRRIIGSAILGAGGLIVAAALAFAAHAAGAFDGTYTGQAALVSGNNSSTCHTFSTSATVTNDHLTYVHGGNRAVINADVAPDGSFSGSAMINAGRARGAGAPVAEILKGKVTGGTLEADVGNPACSYHLLLKKAS